MLSISIRFNCPLAPLLCYRDLTSPLLLLLRSVTVRHQLIIIDGGFPPPSRIEHGNGEGSFLRRTVTRRPERWRPSISESLLCSSERVCTSITFWAWHVWHWRVRYSASARSISASPCPLGSFGSEYYAHELHKFVPTTLYFNATLLTLQGDF